LQLNELQLQGADVHLIQVLSRDVKRIEKSDEQEA
jgi:hypothetical protein